MDVIGKIDAAVVELLVPSDGYWILLRALGPGPHTITFGAQADFPEFGFTFRTLVTYKIVVE